MKKFGPSKINDCCLLTLEIPDLDRGSHLVEAHAFLWRYSHRMLSEAKFCFCSGQALSCRAKGGEKPLPKYITENEPQDSSFNDVRNAV